MGNHITLKPNRNRTIARNCRTAELIPDGPLAKINFIGRAGLALPVNLCQTPINEPAAAFDTITVLNRWPCQSPARQE